MDVETLSTALGSSLDAITGSLVKVRRDLHAHPELAHGEVRTSRVIAEQLQQAGIEARLLPGSGVIADLGASDAAYRVALRADLDALPLMEATGHQFASVYDGVAHACGHDVHVVSVLGAGIALRRQQAELERRRIGIRLIFQPAEEVIPGGAQGLIERGALDDVDRIFGIHCDPSVDVGQVGLKDGALTAAADAVTVALSGRGGHTSRPHLTEDLTYALAKVITDVPAALSRRLDPRAGAALVWGTVHAGGAQNVIPSAGTVSGTLRILDAAVWREVGPLIDDLVQAIVAPYGVHAKVEHERGVPPVVNDPASVHALRAAAQAAIGPDAVVPTKQSLGGEDFAWYVMNVPGAMARLGTRTPGGPTYDLHRGDLVIDEAAIGLGARLLAHAALGSAP